VTISKKSRAIPVWCGGVAGHNSNHERSQSQERVLGDGLSHGSTLKSPFEGSPVFKVFRRSSVALAKEDQSVSIRVNPWLSPAFDQRKLAKISGFKFREILCILWLKTVFPLPFSLPLP